MTGSPSFINRTFKRIRTAWEGVSSGFFRDTSLEFAPSLEDSDLEKLKEAINFCLAAPSGEVSARNAAVRIGQAYLTLNPEGRERFLRLLGTDYDVDNVAINRAIADYQRGLEGDNLPKLRHLLRKSLTAPRIELLTLFNALPEGIKFLVDMRAELLVLGRKNDSYLNEVERDLKHLLRSWFDVGFLKLRQINWDSPASILEKLIEYEAVHQVASWDDLKNRLADDRRLFAFFHPNMPKEPLIFIHAALVKGLANNVQVLLDPETPPVDLEEADTAIFYSISNAQQGLAGISFGNFLIKRVVGEVKKELPQLKQFATLSPIPGFRSWLDKQSLDILNEEERTLLAELCQQHSVDLSLPGLLERVDWQSTNDLRDALADLMTRLCVVFLAQQHPRKPRLLDPVAHFHSSNGAMIQQINWLGDLSSKGISQSYGLMVNYAYPLDKIDSNSELYAQTHSANVSNKLQSSLQQN